MSALISQLEGHRAISLEEVLQAAELQTRVDRKYLLTPAQFSGLAETLGSRFRCLEIEGKRIHGYESVYFDTADLALFRAHRQGRRHRYKVRTRTYTDSDQCLVEVKMKGRRGATIKKRMDYRSELRCDLDPNARRFLAE
ncbi:MAG: VTC domain-containing protein, partial [Nocardioidaceae bacterium]|nr:VTC domain-containing protein [Nocardioidaceae bacterium]